jgi:hypothetical protein
MSRKFQLEEHLRALLVEDRLCYEECDWERLNQIRMAIDDTRDQLADIEAEWALVMHEAQHNQ